MFHTFIIALCLVAYSFAPVAVLGDEPTKAAKAEELEAQAALDRDLKTLFDVLQGDLDQQDQQTLTSFDGDKRTPIKALITLIRFRQDPAKHRKELFSVFAVDDYEARSRHQYNMREAPTMIESMRELESNHPTLTAQQTLLLAFLHYKDENVWFAARGRRVSAARMLRTAFLGFAFEDSPQHDALEIANAIDKQTRQAFEAAKAASKR